MIGFSTFVSLILSGVSVQATAPLKPQTVEASSEQAQRTLQRYSDCVVKQSALTDEVAHYLRQPVTSAEATEATKALIVPRCLTTGGGQTQMTMRGPLFRGALYEAIYRDRHARRAVDFSTAAPLELAKEYDSEPVVEDVYFRSFGDCVARGAAGPSRALVLSKSGTPQERDALTAIQPVLPDCLPKDQTLKFSRPILRGVIAEALVKLSSAATPSSAN